MAIVLALKVEKAASLLHYMKEAGFSDTLIRHHKKHPYIYHDGVALLLEDWLAQDQVLAIYLPEEKNEIPPQSGDLSILYEDEFVLLLDKPAGLATLGTGAHYHHNLAAIVSNYYQIKGIQSKIHFINRLDYETSGLTLLAKHQYIHGLFSNKAPMIKKYYALVEGQVTPVHGWIEAPILRLPPPSTKREINPGGQPAKTEYQVVRYIQNTTLLELTLHTGRTHQIRVHLASINHPLVGDRLYGCQQAQTFYLQSYYLSFQHPISKKWLSFSLPSPF